MGETGSDHPDHPTKWPSVYIRFCEFWLARTGQPFDPAVNLTHWDTFLAGWRAAGRSGAH